MKGDLYLYGKNETNVIQYLQKKTELNDKPKLYLRYKKNELYEYILFSTSIHILNTNVITNHFYFAACTYSYMKTVKTTIRV